MSVDWHQWIGSVAGSMLVGLSGIVPLLIIPDSKKLQDSSTPLGNLLTWIHLCEHSPIRKCVRKSHENKLADSHVYLADSVISYWLMIDDQLTRYNLYLKNEMHWICWRQLLIRNQIDQWGEVSEWQLQCMWRTIASINYDQFPQKW